VIDDLDDRFPEVGTLTDALGGVGYLAGEQLSSALFLAVRMRQPILLEGEPGVGKTGAAKALATALDTALVRLQCYEGIAASEALYEWNYPRQLLAIRLAEAAGEQIRDKDLFSPDYLLSRPLLTALLYPGPRPAVLLIDEIDRADDEFEAFLFEMLAESAVTIPELGTQRAVLPPVTVLTSNRTRDLHDALKRRCLYHWIAYPDTARVAEIIRRRVPASGERLAGQVAAAVQSAALAESPVTGAPVTVPSVTGRGVSPDVAATAAAFGVALHRAGMPVGPDRCERLARAVIVMHAASLAELRACALATMVSDPAQLPVFDRVFAAVFGAPAPSGDQLPAVRPAVQRPDAGAEQPGAGSSAGDPGGVTPGPQLAEAGPPPGDDGDETLALRRVASATEQLRGRDFTDLSAAELRQLLTLMREMTLAIPPRRTRRYRGPRKGTRPDLRRTMRQARRNGGEVIRLSYRARVVRPRRLVVLCDISGSMEPYARALLLLLYALNGGKVRGGQNRPEVFSFATRLTRLTPALAAAGPDTMLAKAGEAAPDWSGGTRIGAALKEFNDRYGSRGMARGAVVLIISDGWDTGDPGLVGRQMARLSRMAYRIVWANPRTQSPRYRPEVGGMAAAWPFCDAVVSAHSLDALDDLLAALS
jgi:uncharacterized protein with von Willebrand factor type A (vWA) domain